MIVHSNTSVNHHGTYWCPETELLRFLLDLYGQFSRRRHDTDLDEIVIIEVLSVKYGLYSLVKNIQFKQRVNAVLLLSPIGFSEELL